MGSAPSLSGRDALEAAQVDQWIVHLRSKTLPLAKMLAGAVFGSVDMTADEHAFLSNLIKENLKTLNNQLKSRQWLCGGDGPTFADYLFVISIVELEQCVMDSNLRTSLNFLHNHFKKVAALDEVRGRMGALKLGKKQLTAVCLSQKKEAAPAAEKKSKKKK